MVSADSTSTTHSIGFRISSGILIPHERSLKPLKKGNIKSFELSYSLIKYDSKAWRSFYNHPEVGVSYMFMDLGYQEVLGYSHSIYPYIEFPIIKHNRSLALGFKVALGLSYFTKMYDSISNRSNIAISTPINMYASLGLNLSYRFADKVSANVGVNASHFSNSSIKKPNYGLNIPLLNIGFNYNFNSNARTFSKTRDFDTEKTEWLIIITGGVKETKDPGGSKYGIGSFSVEYSKPFKTFLRYGASFDYMYDGSTFVHFREDSVPYHSRFKASKAGISLLGEMSLYRLSAFGNLGIYIYNYDKQLSAIYQKVGLRYRITESIHTQIALKTHLNVADYFEFGVGLRL